MTRTPPLDDWVVYAIVLGTVAAMMFGKYLMARGDKNQVFSTNEDTNNTQKIEKDIKTDVKS
ncbi:MAG: hypothetical protein DRG78_12380 [Epsilonproteobacteria bacterium]|nr:MAG: hypothetical protein DRG78_12380 [Campylobacterota bacterium]